MSGATDGFVASGSPLLGYGSDGRLTHLPALDGLRGLAVAAVVCFHGNWVWARGGFLGVSLFFTLSGFLITSLLIAESRRSGGVDLRSFWRRRFRRLMPASLLTLAVVATVLIVRHELTASARWDIWAALANVANWRFIASGSSYNDLFTHPSPVRHFWSLAIEEQAYLVLPFVAWAVLRVRRGTSHRSSSVRSLGMVLGAGWLASVVATALVSGADRVYYGTDTRASELLIGALLAVVVADDSVRRRIVNSLWVRWAVIGLGAAALVATVIAWTTIEVSDGIVSHGGLVIVGVISAVLILSASLGRGPVAAIGQWSVLRWLGTISYGVYLFHWPIFVFADRRHTGLSDGPRFVVCVAATLLLAVASHRWFEMPLRRGEVRWRWVTPGRAAPVIIAALVLVMALVPAADPALGGFDAEAAATGLDALTAKAPPRDRPIHQATVGTSTGTSSGTGGSANTTTTTLPPAPAPRISIFGDSVALSVAYPLHDWALTSNAAVFVGGQAQLGCGIGRGGWQNAIGVARRRADCDNWPQTWGAAIAAAQPDLALVMDAQWELVPRRLEGETTWRVIGEPAYDDYLRGEFVAAIDTLSSGGAEVVWLTVPRYGVTDDAPPTVAMRDSHRPERVDRLNQIIREAVAQRPGHAVVLDLAAWMADKTEDPSLRKDGAHFNSKGADRVATEFLGPQLLQIWDQRYHELVTVSATSAASGGTAGG